MLVGGGFELVGTVDEVGVLEGVEFVDNDFFNNILYVLAFLVLTVFYQELYLLQFELD